MAVGGIGFGSYDAYRGAYTGYNPGVSRSDGGVTDSAADALRINASEGSVKLKVHSESDAKDAGLSDAEIKGLKRSGQIECATCASRTYQDGSDEEVSFKSAAHISPEASAARVRGHEQEHVSNAFKKAATGNGRVLQASVAIHTATCPECGKSYVSGGLTTTKIAYSDDKYGQNAKSADAASIVGSNFNLAV